MLNAGWLPDWLDSLRSTEEWLDCVESLREGERLGVEVLDDSSLTSLMTERRGRSRRGEMSGPASKSLPELDENT